MKAALKEKTFAEIIAEEPQISEADLRDFKAICDSEAGKAHSKWGKDLRKLNIGNHKLGNGGYRAKVPLWEKEDAERAEKGIPDPLAQYSPRTKNFIKARYTYDPVTNEYTTDDDKVKELFRNLVSNTPP